jgi:hypothetical protein
MGNDHRDCDWHIRAMEGIVAKGSRSVVTAASGKKVKRLIKSGGGLHGKYKFWGREVE